MAKKLDTIGKKKITIPEIQYITLWVGISLAIVFYLVAKFCFNCTIPESIAIFAGVIATVAAVYNALHLTNNFNLNEQKYLLDKKLASLAVITEWYKDFAEKTLIIKSFREKYYIQQQMKPDQLIKFINENPINSDVVAFRKSIRPIFNYFEKISIGIKAEAYDGNILKDAFFDLFTNYYTMFLPLIKDNRVGAGTMRHAYLEFEILAESWNQPKQQN